MISLEHYKARRFWACSSVRLERTPDKREVGGSIPPRPTMIGGPGILDPNGGVAQLGERLPCTQEVIGSNPFTSTFKWLMNVSGYLREIE